MRLRITAWIGALTAALLGARAAAADELRLVTGHWCPFVCTEAGELTGIVPELAAAIFAEHGIRVTLVPASYTRALELVRRGDADGVVTTREDAPDLVFPAVEQGLSTNTFFVRAGNPWRYVDPSSFEQLHRLGIVQSYNYLELAEAIARSPAKVDQIAGSEVVQRIIRKLLAGRFDAFIYDAEVTEFELRSMGLAAEIIAAGSLRGAQPVYVGFSPKQPGSRRHAELLSAGMQTLRARGELARILARYGMKDWRTRGRAPAP